MNELVITSKSSGKDVTTSLIIAEVFGKDHRHVLRDIDQLSCSQEFRERNFGLSSYVSVQNKTLPMFEITRDGFAFLVMGYTGEKAGQFKEKFITEFNKREALLKDDDYILQRSQEILSKRVNLLEQRLREKETQLEIQQGVVKEQAPKVRYHDEVLMADGGIPTTIIAKELGMSAKALNNLLHSKRVIYKQRDCWLLYSVYQNQGYMRTQTFPYVDNNGNPQTKITTVWTEKGRKFIHNLMKEVQINS